MQKLTLSSSLLLLLFASCSKPVVSEKEIPVSKTIEFRLAQATDYSAPMYDGVQAEVRLSISKQVAGANTPVILWDTIIPYQSLRVYPASATPLMINKQFNGIVESKESIRFNKVVRYKDGLNQTSMNASGEDIPSSVSNKLVMVDL
jgi:hypothetical protein